MSMSKRGIGFFGLGHWTKKVSLQAVPFKSVQCPMSKGGMGFFGLGLWTRQLKTRATEKGRRPSPLKSPRPIELALKLIAFEPVRGEWSEGD